MNDMNNPYTAPMQAPQQAVAQAAEPLAPTTIAQMQQYAKGTLLKLPDFDDGQPFVARVKRPSMLALMKNGTIPNSLLAAANALFTGTAQDRSANDDELYKDVAQVTDIVAAACLLSPTYEEITNAGLQLTDEQLFALFNYTQGGVKALEPFRDEQANSPASAEPGAGVANTAE